MRRLVPLLLGVLALAGCGPDPVPSKSSPTAPTESKDDPRKNPCHPGCFPAGTLVNTPSGVREIQSVRKGENVSIIAADGTIASGSVESVFETCNTLLDLTTDAGTLRTTETQPLCLASGGFVEAGHLKRGDRIWKWVDAKRTAATVSAIDKIEGTSAVFNLVVGTEKVFVANGFLARGKPPQDR